MGTTPTRNGQLPLKGRGGGPKPFLAKRKARRREEGEAWGASNLTASRGRMGNEQLPIPTKVNAGLAF